MRSDIGEYALLSEERYGESDADVPYMNSDVMRGAAGTGKWEKSK